MNKLLNEFPPVSTEAWEATIAADLKGADYEKKLVWKTWEGINVKPYYRSSDVKDLNWLLENLPAEFPFVRGGSKNGNRWEVRAEIFESDIAVANASAKRNLERGADALGLRSVVREGKLLGQNVQSQADFAQLLAGVDLSKTAVHLDWGVRGAQALAMLANHAESSVGMAQVRGTLAYDLFAELVTLGELPLDAAHISTSIAKIGTFAQQNLPGVRPLIVQGHVWHNAGANAVQELSIALATGAAFMDALTEAKIPAAQAAKLIGFSVSVGSNYFFEMAKIRALRLLWSSVLAAYGVKDVPVYVHGRTSQWNATVFDPAVNMLRCTTEGMSAVLAGCNALSVMPYDSAFRCPDEFSYRVARNTQLVLRDETGFDRLVDPSAGSYYIESITDTLAAKALAHFQGIEAKGGLLAALTSGSLQKELGDLLAKRIKAVEQRRESLLGTNSYPNFTEKMAERIEAPTAVAITGPIQDCACADVAGFRQLFSGGACDRCHKNSGKTTVAPLRIERGAEVFERIRLATEAFAARTGAAPKVFLWTAGNLAMRLARATFVKNFFGCAGYEVIDSNGIPSAAAGIEILKQHTPQIVVLCSSDDEYDALAAEVIPALAQAFPKAIPVVAGYPEASLEALKAAGVQEFIHVRTNAAESLASYQSKLGVN